MRLLMCGSREWKKTWPVYGVIIALAPDVVIEGDARGADRLSGYIAKNSGIAVETYPAHWDRYGKGAGPKRNQQMIAEGKPDLVVAFSEDIANSVGTSDMLCRAENEGIPYFLVDGD